MTVLASRKRRSNRKRTVNSLGIATRDSLRLEADLRAGLPFAALVRFQKKSQLTMAEISRVVQLPKRTLARRKATGRLSQFESERLHRLANIHQRAVELFDGDCESARLWLQSPRRALDGRTPLQAAESEIGGQEVVDLIGRLEHGVFS